MTDGQEINRLKLENTSLKKRTQEAEGELSIVKGIGNNSPEMKALIEQNHRLIKRVDDLKVINKSHQKLNGQLQERLSQYEDKAAHYRRKAIL